MEAPPPMSFPATLRNPGLSDRFAHLQTSTSLIVGASTIVQKFKGEHEGKRWIRRKENERFTGNPHIVAASKLDSFIPIPQTRATFPEPLPSYLPRTVKVPTAAIPEPDPNSANAGRFSVSLKGMRRELRRSGFRAELLVRDVENEILEWLQGGIVLNPDSHEADSLTATGVPVGNTGTIFEVSRTPLQYHEIVSFSKEIAGRRLTYLLRPNVTRPDHYAITALDTPPVTDLDYSSYADTESDRGGPETDSDAEQLPANQASHLPVITEDPSLPSSPKKSPPRLDEDQWAVTDAADLEDADSGSNAEVVAPIEAIVREPGPTGLRSTSEADSHLRQKAIQRRRQVLHQKRANSSPSRSPVRCMYPKPRMPKPPLHQQRPFYEYLFS
ncbi:hypothetical protein C0993_006359 [Termitomyces sp. T159_Od127]|nr:hypothetical protein C0993_006359 [Termitomyces sp. T159_Od127]